MRGGKCTHTLSESVGFSEEFGEDSARSIRFPADETMVNGECFAVFLQGSPTAN